MPHTREERAAIAAAWRASAIDQFTFAKNHGISARTLRLWLQQHPAPTPSVEEVRKVVEEAIGKLQAMLEALPFPTPPTCPPQLAPQPVAVSPQEKETPLPRRGFNFDADYE